MKNYTGPGDFTSTVTQVHSLSTALDVLFAVLSIFLAVTASLGNFLILLVLHKVSSIHPPTKLLFRCLAFTDLFVGLIVQPLYVTKTYFRDAVGSKINSNTMFFIDKTEHSLSFVLCAVSIFTSTAISVDRVLSLKLGLRYRHIVTLRRVRVVIFCIWLIAALGGCMAWFFSSNISFTVGIVCALLCVFISVSSYTKIFLKLRQHQAEVQGHFQQGNDGITPINLRRYKRTVSSIAWVQLALVVCYVPYEVTIAIIVINGPSGMSIAWSSVIVLLYSNSSLNPIVYFWRLPEVRQAVKERVAQCFCLSG